MGNRVAIPVFWNVRAAREANSIFHRQDVLRRIGKDELKLRITERLPGDAFTRVHHDPVTHSSKRNRH